MESRFETGIWKAQRRVLVIEPDRRYSGVIGRRLSDFGFRVAAADCAQSGFAEMYRVPVDLVLCEAKLPGSSGIEFVRMVRDDPVHHHVPVLLLIGRSDPDSAIKAFAAGADGIVRKPGHFEVLAACIARQIERADAVRRLTNDKAALDARAISRAIELEEAREMLSAAEVERLRLAAIVEGRAA